MYSKELEELIENVLADGVVTEQERAVLRKRALACGEDPDEVMIVVEGRLAKSQKAKNPSKHGNVVKCPSCGAPVKAGTMICEECGYEFKNVRVNSTVEKFSEELKALRENQRGGIIGQALDVGESKRVAFIENYPVPNTVDDIWELMILAKQKGEKNGIGEEQAYWKLFCKCADKVENSDLRNDVRFAELLAFYKKENKKKNLTGRIIGTLFVVMFIGLGCWLGFMFYGIDKANERIDNAITHQLDSLTAEIDKLPMPTKDNYQECAYRISKMVWSPVNCRVDGSLDDTEALDKKQINAIKSFVMKKNSYIHFLNKVNDKDTIANDYYVNYTTSVSED